MVLFMTEILNIKPWQSYSWQEDKAFQDKIDLSLAKIQWDETIEKQACLIIMQSLHKLFRKFQGIELWCSISYT